MMKIIIYAVIVILFLILVFMILKDIDKSLSVKKYWPKNLSKETKLEIWNLFSVPGRDDYLVKICDLYLTDYPYFFNNGYITPSNCGATNPVVMINDMGAQPGNEIILAKTSFVKKYANVTKFDKDNQPKNT